MPYIGSLRWRPFMGAQLKPSDNVKTVDPVWAPAPGQAAVLYDGEECLGGGRIARSDT